MKHSGTIIQLPDQRLCIVYNEQPLKEKGKIVLHLVDEHYNLVIGENQKPKILLRDVQNYVEEMECAKVVGYVD